MCGSCGCAGLRAFLQAARSQVAEASRIVIGNEALDMDTAAMTVSYAYLLTKQKKELHYPVMNLKSDLYHLKTEVVHQFKKLGIDKADLIFLDNLPEIGNKFETTLVDCNVYKGALTNKLDVVRIQDHHKIETDVASLKYANESENVGPPNGLGSGSTLILEKIREHDPTPDAACLSLLHAAIILDTTNFSTNIGQVHERDIAAFDYIKQQENLQLSSFEELSEAKFSVDGFSREDALLKDAKYICNDTIIIAALACSAEKFTALEEDKLAVSLDKFMAKHKFQQVFAISKILKDENARDIRELVVYPRADEHLRDFILGDKALEAEMVSDDGVSSVFRWWNMKPTRKYILPLLQQFYD